MNLSIGPRCTEEKILVYLRRDGALNASELQRRCKCEMERIYYKLTEMRRKGLVSQIRGRGLIRYETTMVKE